MSADATPPPAEEGNPQGGKAVGVPHLSSTIEVVSKFVLFVSGALYAVGLIVANLSAQRYGRYTLSLVEGQYVLVGMLWLALALLTFTLMSIARKWARFEGPWKGRSLTKNLLNAVWVLLLCLGLVTFFSQAALFLGLEGPYFGRKALAIFGIMMLTDGCCSRLFQEVSKAVNQQAVSGNVFIANLSKANWYEIINSLLSFFGSVQESGRDPDFSGVWPRRCQAPRCRRRCGNVGTRVWCGFPSAGEYPVWDSPRLIRRVISTATLQIRPILV